MKYTIYTLAFIEGFLVVAFELLVARMLAPTFGGSLFVLTSVLGVTLISLLLGYYFGSLLVKKNNFDNYLFFIQMSAVLLILSPLISEIIINFIDLKLIPSTILSVVCLLGISLFLLGSVSPQLIQVLSNENTQAGEISGKVFSISTFGGFVATFILGLWLIVDFGVKKTCYLVGGSALVILFTIYFFKRELIKFNHFGFIIILFLVGWSLQSMHTPETNSNYQIMYESESILGKIQVKEFQNNIRVLSNNGMDQSAVNNIDSTSIFHYVHVISSLANLMPAGNRNHALILGLAGGSLIHEFKYLGYENIDVVDIDKRAVFLAEKYFYCPSKFYNFFEDDGRHFLSSVDTKYDIIVIDVSASDEQPYHLYTTQAVKLFSEKLHDPGFLIFNIIDYTQFNKLIITNRIASAMLENQLDTRLLQEFHPKIDEQTPKISTLINEKILLGIKSKAQKVWSTKNTSLRHCCYKYTFNHTMCENLDLVTFKLLTPTYQSYSDDCPLMEVESFDKSQLLRKFVKS